jgi:hypothetical protein
MFLMGLFTDLRTFCVARGEASILQRLCQPIAAFAIQMTVRDPYMTTMRGSGVCTTMDTANDGETWRTHLNCC